MGNGYSLQKELNRLLGYCDQNQMVMNGKKTEIILFNSGRKYDFMPKLTLNGQYLQVVDKFKLLGIHIRSDMKWYDNTDKGMEDYES